MFKRGDVVFYRDQKDDVGVVDRPHESRPGEVWVNWTSGPDRDCTLHCRIDELTLCTENVSEYDAATLKKMLDKMDDNIVFSFTDLKIHFNKE